MTITDKPKKPLDVARARKDFRYFCENFLTIKLKRRRGDTGPPTGGFVFNDAQELIWEVMQEQWMNGGPIKLCICKGRQFGVSTFFLAWAYWWMWLVFETSTALAAQNTKTIGELTSKIDLFYRDFPEIEYRALPNHSTKPQLRSKQKGSKVNKADMYWPDWRSSFTTEVAKKDALRGLQLDVAICTEVAAYPDPVEFFQGFVPAMNWGKPWATLVYESSPQDGFFKDLYESSRDDGDEIKAIFLPWWCMPNLCSIDIQSEGRGSRKRYFTTIGKVKEIEFDEEEIEEWESLNALAAHGILIGGKLKKFPEITAGQMYWRQLSIAEDFHGDRERFDTEYPRDDISCFALNSQSAFKPCLDIVRRTTDHATLDKECHLEVGHLSSDTFYDSDKEQVVTFTPVGKYEKWDMDRNPALILFERPVPGHTYTIGADIASELGSLEEGDDSAFSAACVYDCDTRSQVAEWRGKIDESKFGNFLVMLGYYYNEAMLNIEINSMGVLTHRRITELDYPNPARWPEMDEPGKFHPRKTMFLTTSKTKPYLINGFKEACTNWLFIVRSPELRHEMEAYVFKDGKYQRTNMASDRIIAAALAWTCVFDGLSDGFMKEIVLGAKPPSSAFEEAKAEEEKKKRALVDNRPGAHYKASVTRLKEKFSQPFQHPFRLSSDEEEEADEELDYIQSIWDSDNTPSWEEFKASKRR